MFDDRPRNVSFVAFIMFLIAFMPLSVIVLSASCSFSIERSCCELERARIVLMPRRRLVRFKAFEFFTFFFYISSLKIFALSNVTPSPVSWQRALKRST